MLIDFHDGIQWVIDTGVSFDAIINAFNRDMSPEEISGTYPSVTLADINEVIAWYLQNKDAHDNHLRQQEERAEKLRQQVESGYTDMLGIAARLQEQWAAEKKNKE